MFKYWWELIYHEEVTIKPPFSQLREIGFLYQVMANEKMFLIPLVDECIIHKFGDWTQYDETIFFKTELDAIMFKMLFN